MNDRIKTLDMEARQLTPEERFELVEKILTRVHQIDPEKDAAWAREAKDRLDAWRSGELPSRPIDDALAKHRKP